MDVVKTSVVNVLALFTSLGTLICCALPALFVALGAGAALAGIVSAAPQLVWLSEHKTGLFLTAAAMLVLAGAAMHRGRNAPCPADPAKAAACARLRRFSIVTYVLSLAIYATGFFFAFIAPLLMS